jgi:cytochrome c-type biogenesis protein CcmE
MPKKLRFAVGASLMVGAIAYLIITAVRNTAEYYLTVNEVKARQAELSGQMLRVAGRVVAGSVSWQPASLTLKFAIAQPAQAPSNDPAPTVTEASLPDRRTSVTQAGMPDDTHPAIGGEAAAVSSSSFYVVSRGQPKPDMFAPGRDVIVEGKLGTGDTIEARQVLTSCPSKYSPKTN